MWIGITNPNVKTITRCKIRTNQYLNCTVLNCSVHVNVNNLDLSINSIWKPLNVLVNQILTFSTCVKVLSSLYLSEQVIILHARTTSKQAKNLNVRWQFPRSIMPNVNNNEWMNGDSTTIQFLCFLSLVSSV